jgi:tungstate transport system substrate-binding protein
MLASRVALLFLLLGLGSAAAAEEKSIVVASTTSTQDSGLFGHILPLFKAKSGIEVKVVAQGTGQALDTGRRCDADVVFVHAKAQEEKFVAEGFGVKRFQVMYNDFVVVGPKSDPAGIKGGKDVLAAFRSIYDKAVPFVSRGDRSGTHSAELGLWKAANLDPSDLKPSWYHEVGQGMGPTLNIATEMQAYTLPDRGTWIAFKNKDGFEILVEGDNRLFNQYGVILVNPAKCPTVKKDWGQAFIDWLVSADGQNAIRAYKIDGQQLFFPNATTDKAEADSLPCEQFAWSVGREIESFAAPDLPTVASGASLQSPPERGFELKLQPQSQVTFVAQPERDPQSGDRFAGVVSFSAILRRALIK